MEAQAQPEVDAPPRPQRLWLHILLFGVTFLTTTLVGLEMSLGRAEAGMREAGPTVGFWLDALSYSVSIMAILMAHEMGHYLQAKRRGVDASLPYFIPMISAFGTFGAFIRMRLDRQVPAEDLLRIAAWGPLAGLAVILPVLGVGMALSDVRPSPEDLETGVALGDSVLLWLSQRLVFGDLPPGMDVWLHPMAFAGWAGVFVTAFNLIPIGQLDGGHIAYALFGERFNRVVAGLFIGLMALGVAVFPGWLVLCILLVIIGVAHPPLCPDAPVQRSRSRVLGWVTLGCVVLCFTPQPFGGVPTLLDWLMR